MKHKQAKKTSAGVGDNQDKSFSIVLLLTILSSVVFAIIFFSHRGEDVGQITQSLSTILSSFKSGKIINARAMFEISGGVIVALMIVFSWYGLGYFIVKTINTVFGSETFTSNKYVEVSAMCAVGSGIWSVLWFFLGIAHLYQKSVALIAVICGIALSLLKLIKDRSIKSEETADDKQGKSKSNKILFAKFALIVITIPVVMAFISALAPPTGKDELIYHLSLPKVYVKEGALIEVQNNIASYYAHGAEMHGVWALLLGSFINERVAEVAFGVTLFSFFPLVLFAVYGWTTELTSNKEWALTAMAFIATVPTAFYVASHGYIDLALTLYLLIAVRYVALWWKSQNNFHLFLVAVALGAALATKLTATFAFFPLLVIFLLRAREAQSDEDEDGKPKTNANKILLAGILSLIIAGVLASPWYLNNWIKTGSPIFPFYPSIWKGNAQGWDVERSQLLQLFLAGYGGSPKSFLDYVAAPFYISLVAQSEKATYYDGVIGVSFIVGVICLLAALWKFETSVELKIIAGVAATLFFCWLFSSQQLRFLLPTLALLSVAIATSANTIVNSIKKDNNSLILGWSLLATTLCGFLVISAWFLSQNPLRVSLGGETREDYLRRKLDYYPYYEIINKELPSDTKIWLVNMRRDSYHLNRPYFSDYTFEDYTIVKYVKEAKDLKELRARVRADGITHLLVRHDNLLNYEKSPVVDERLSTQENKAKMELINALLKDGTKVLRSDNKFILVELP